jgi:deoxyribodipyrimidine photo-lyase
MKDFTLFIFRRDLRLIDNKGLAYTMKNFENILPIFIFTPEQVGDDNKFRSENAIQYMIESLRELDQELKKYGSKLHLFYGDNIEILEQICATISVQNIVFNMDYTPYAIKRDKSIQQFCNNSTLHSTINCVMIEDYLLANIGTFCKSDGDPYTIFTPFKNNVLQSVLQSEQRSIQKIDKPIRSNIVNLTKTDKLKESGYIKYQINTDILLNGGRKEGLKILNQIKKQNNYNKTRNTVSIETSHLSAPIKFGCISIREVYWKIVKELGISNDLLSQIFWREFYYYIVYYFPDVLKGKNYNNRYDKLNWINNKTNFHKWTIGETGYPIVDAGMRQMNQTGYMHNRARLITSNFLNRMLGMDWRKGEKYYAQRLTDYDPAVNNGNWQWIASTGVDPKPYFQRLFNPMIQSEKFDVDAKYIKKWIPQLKDIPAQELHNWSDYCQNYDLKQLNYVEPIVDYKEARERSVKMYKSV